MDLEGKLKEAEMGLVEEVVLVVLVRKTQDVLLFYLLPIELSLKIQ